MNNNVWKWYEFKVRIVQNQELLIVVEKYLQEL